MEVELMTYRCSMELEHMTRVGVLEDTLFDIQLRQGAMADLSPAFSVC